MPDLLQDLDRGLSKALERDPNARQLVREAAAEHRLAAAIGQRDVLAGLLREALGPLEVSAAIIEDEDGGERMDDLVSRITAALSAIDESRAATPCGQVNNGTVCATPRIGSERLCPDCNPRAAGSKA